jgi:hypothetical protein
LSSVRIGSRASLGACARRHAHDAECSQRHRVAEASEALREARAPDHGHVENTPCRSQGWRKAHGSGLPATRNSIR